MNLFSTLYCESSLRIMSWILTVNQITTVNVLFTESQLTILHCGPTHSALVTPHHRGRIIPPHLQSEICTELFSDDSGSCRQSHITKYYATHKRDTDSMCVCFISKTYCLSSCIVHSLLEIKDCLVIFNFLTRVWRTHKFEVTKMGDIWSHIIRTELRISKNVKTQSNNQTLKLTKFMSSLRKCCVLCSALTHSDTNSYDLT